MNHERTLHERVNSFHKKAYEEDSKFTFYLVDRGLNVRRFINHVNNAEWVPTYQDHLPLFEGKNIEEIIDEKIQQNGHASILDIGCGAGRFLLDVKDMWGDAITPVGISGYAFHENPTSAYEGIEGVRKSPTKDELKEKNVRIAVGDVHSMPDLLKKEGLPDKYDIALSVMAFGYLSDPLLALKKVYGSLKEGGIGLISDLDNTEFMSDKTYKGLLLYLQSYYGFEVSDFDLLNISAGHLAFRKTKPHLSLPVSYRAKKNSLRYVPRTK